MRNDLVSVEHGKRKEQNEMSFSADLSSLCKLYAEFTYNSYSLQLPYQMGGKNTPNEITDTLSEWIGHSVKTKEEIQKYVTDNPSVTGIDCSGLVYYVLNEASDGAVRKYFEEKLGLPGQLTYKYGISAANLTSEKYGSKLTVANAVKPGCVICFDNGNHVLVIHSVVRNYSGSVTSIGYTHSNGSKGPHYGNITIGEPMRDLNDRTQTWHDSAYTDATAKNYYNYTLLLEPTASYT